MGRRGIWLSREVVRLKIGLPVNLYFCQILGGRHIICVGHENIVHTPGIRCNFDCSQISSIDVVDNQFMIVALIVQEKAEKEWV